MIWEHTLFKGDLESDLKDRSTVRSKLKKTSISCNLAFAQLTMLRRPMLVEYLDISQ
jgi:hypothetical protein